MRWLNVAAGDTWQHPKMAQVQYEVRFFNHGGYTVGTAYVRAESDEEAIRYALRVLQNPFGRGHEIWQGERLVHREMYAK